MNDHGEPRTKARQPSVWPVAVVLILLALIFCGAAVFCTWLIFG